MNEINNNNLQNNTRERQGVMASIVGIIVNVILASLKLFIGLVAGSIAIIADALNNYTDSATSIMSFVSFKLASKPADKSHPFGHARIEYIISMMVSVMILIVGFELFTESISGFFTPEIEIPEFNVITFVVLGLSIFGKLALALYYRAVSIRISSSVIKASFVDSLYDSVATFAILVSTVIIKYTGFAYADSITGLLVSMMIFKAGFEVLNETKNSLLGEAPLDEVVDKIKAIVENYPNIVGIHDLMVHNYGPNHYIASFHAEVDGAKDIYLLHDEIDNAERQVCVELGIQCTIHMDPIVTDDEEVSKLREFTLNCAKRICSDSTIHDFRTVVGITHTNLIFDLVLPFDIKEDPSVLVERLQELISTERPDHYCVITVDRG